MNQSIALAAHSISKKFSLPGPGKELNILQNLNLEVVKADTVAIVGASGSGKTTLLSILAGLDLPDQGNVLIDGEDITLLSERERSILRAKKLAFVFQDFLLLPHLTALENIMLPLEMSGERQARQKALAELENIGLGERASHYPSQLSGGEQQRIGLARAFVSHPHILFADEPSGNLDNATGDQIAQLLFEMNNEYQTTLILVTHNLQLAKRCSQIYELRNQQLEVR